MGQVEWKLECARRCSSTRQQCGSNARGSNNNGEEFLLPNVGKKICDKGLACASWSIKEEETTRLVLDTLQHLIVCVLLSGLAKTLAHSLQ